MITINKRFSGYDSLDLESDPEQAWERIRASLSCVCLPLKRLRLTAEVWRDKVRLHFAGQGQCTSGSRFLLRAAEWILNADFAEWLAPDPSCRTAQQHTYRHGLISLSILEVQPIHLPDLSTWTSDHDIIFVGSPPRDSPIARLCDTSVCYPHAESLSRLSEGKELDFFCEEPEQCGFCLSLYGLQLPFASTQTPESAPDDGLRALQFACDLIRFTVRLWTRGTRACLFLPVPAGDDVRLLSGIPGAHFHQDDDRASFWVGPSTSPFDLFHLP